MGIRQIIREYTDKIVEGDFDAPEGVCDNCRLKPDADAWPIDAFAPQRNETNDEPFE